MENKTARRVSILQRILRPQKRCVYANSTNSTNISWEISKVPEDLQNAYNIIFTQEALNFLSEIVTEFDERIDQLHWNRLQNKIHYNKELPKFSNSPQRNDKTWKISALPKKLQCRWIDLGDVSPANTNHLLMSLNSNVQGIQIDFDDGHCPTWRNQILGLYNVYCIIHNLNQFETIPNISKLPVLMLRPRAWNMIEHNIMINGKKVAGPLVDFALLMYHNGQKLTSNGDGPFFYLSKLESASEAKLWNDIFIFAQNRLNIPRGTIKACVLIENILCSFEMHDILYELREHSLGLNCGIWDYAASIINKFGNNRSFVLPDRNKYVNMEKHFLRKYMELVVQVCHERGAPATGGMAAHTLLTNDIINKVRKAKTNEIIAGCDGFLIYDVKLIPHMIELWQSVKPKPNIDEIVTITEEDLLKMPNGTITLEGLKHNIQVAILFIYNWFLGNGHFIYKGSVEDSATAEISRSQIWQWIRHEAKLEDNSTIITKHLIEQYAAEFLKECAQTKHNRNILSIANELFLDIVTSRYFVDFITTYLNNNCQFRKYQHYS